MIALVDMDGVLTDFTGGAMKHHNLTFNTESGLPEKYNWMYGIMPDVDFWKPLGEDFYSNLNWTKDGKEILNIIEEHYTDTYLLTSPTLHPGCYSGKIKWLKKFLPHYERKIVLTSKKFLCAGANKVLFDDYPRNLDQFRQFGGHGILVPRPWNNLKSVSTIKYIKDRIISTEGY